MNVKHLSVSIDGNEIIKDVNFNLNNSDKVGLVGVNGSGKSTLLKALAKEITIDNGNINYLEESIGYLRQEISHTYDNLSIVNYLKQSTGIDKLELKLKQFEKNLNEQNMNEYGEILNQFLAIDGYNFNENLTYILNGLCFNKSIDMPIKKLSGGEKIKILLASLLLANNDILLLDEPTNNLDKEAVEWLENYLKKSNKKMIIVSHDEIFLDSIVNKIYELKNGIIEIYSMTYKTYLYEKEQKYQRELEEYERKLEEKERIKKQIQKSKEWANKGVNKKSYNDNDKLANNYAKEKTNTSNISKLTRSLENLNIPKFETKKEINFFLDYDYGKGKQDIIIDNLVCGYNDFQTPLLNLEIPFGTRLLISGKNGSGKTTFVKTLLKELQPIKGNIYIGHDAKIGYISQDTLNKQLDCTILEYLKNNNDDIDLSLIFILLDKFHIPYEDKDKLYKYLSPGERTRVNLVNLALQKTNVLILDEVTNHLDKEALDLVYELVSSYLGTIISISHNRKYNEILKPDLTLNMDTGECKITNI